MQETMVIFLNKAKKEMVDWALISVDGLVLHTECEALTDSLTSWVASRKVIVVLPPEDVTLTTVTLPEMSKSQLIQAVPYALEESMLGDVNQSHFAIGPKAGNGSCPVSIITTAVLSEYLSFLNQHHLYPDAVYASVYAVPYQTGEITLLAESPVLLRFDEHNGLVVDQENLALVMSTLGQAKKITVYGEETLPLDAEFIPMSALTLLHLKAKTIVDANGVNLLQGQFKQKSRTGFSGLSSKKWIGSLLVVWLLILFSYPIASHIILKPKVDSMNQKITQIYHRYFPNNKHVIAPLTRLKEYAHSVIGDDSDDRALLLLSHLADADLAAKKIDIKRFTYENNQMTVELIASSSRDLTDFIATLNQMGVSVKQENVSLIGSSLDAVLEVK